MECAGTYLLFNPNDEEMLRNKAFYMQKLGYHEAHFVPRQVNNNWYACHFRNRHHLWRYSFYYHPHNKLFLFCPTTNYIYYLCPLFRNQINEWAFLPAYIFVFGLLRWLADQGRVLYQLVNLVMAKLDLWLKRLWVTFFDFFSQIKFEILLVD